MNASDKHYEKANYQKNSSFFLYTYDLNSHLCHIQKTTRFDEIYSVFKIKDNYQRMSGKKELCHYFTLKPAKERKQQAQLIQLGGNSCSLLGFINLRKLKNTEANSLL